MPVTTAKIITFVLIFACYLAIMLFMEEDTLVDFFHHYRLLIPATLRLLFGDHMIEKPMK